MAKKQVAVSLRKPPSPEAMDAFVQGDAPPVTEAAPKRARRSTKAERAAVAAEASPAPPSVAPVTLSPESAVQSIDMKEREAAPPTEPTLPPPVDEATPASPVVGPAGMPLRPVTIYLPPALAEKLAMHCIQMDRDASRVIGEALENHLSPRLGAAPSANSSGQEKPKEEASSRGPSGFWDAPPFPRIEWPPKNLGQLIEVGRVLFGVLRRRSATA